MGKHGILRSVSSCASGAILRHFRHFRHFINDYLRQIDRQIKSLRLQWSMSDRRQTDNFYPSAAKLKCPDPADTQDVVVNGGIISFTDQFRYLGSIIADKLTDDAECDARITAASKAFGALKTQLFGVRHICTRAKKHAYEALVLSLLFYGCECWILSAAMRDKVVKFHRRCVRFMCGMDLASMRSKNIHHIDLERRLRVPDILSILEARRLQWLGHVFRMSEDRLPRRLLSAWVMCPRPKGRPPLTYAHGIVNDLKTHGLFESWSTLALDRLAWRVRIRGIRKSRPIRGRVSSGSSVTV